MVDKLHTELKTIAGVHFRILSLPKKNIVIVPNLIAAEGFMYTTLYVRLDKPLGPLSGYAFANLSRLRRSLPNFNMKFFNVIEPSQFLMDLTMQNICSVGCSEPFFIKFSDL